MAQAILLYGAGMLWSALLLFLVQPMLVKAVLPWFGGSAGVWTSAMLFFQVGLLLGYLYAYAGARLLRARTQARLHVVLLALSLLALPIVPKAGWKPSGSGEPILRILVLLGATIGLPYLLLSATSPLAQWWCGRGGVRLPYRLFAVSNFGSLAALVAYPVAFEPLLSIRSQLRIWSWVYAGFVALCAAGALWHREVKPEPRVAAEKVPRGEKRLWIVLAACPSILWLGVANHLAQEVAPVPLLWILPLSIYLLSFILCFASERWYRPGLYGWLLPLAWAGMGMGLARAGGRDELRWALPVFTGGLFLCSMFCHGELARRKPALGDLTEYYLRIALGGALGAVFVGLAAPLLFSSFLELPIAIAGCVLLALMLIYGYRAPRQLTRTTLVAVAAFVVTTQLADRPRFRARNFYGSLAVRDSVSGAAAVRVLYHGTVQHGAQFLDAERSRWPTTYYGRESGVARALAGCAHPAMRVGVVGLGVGTLAAYGRPGDLFRFYEINPLVIEIARRDFHFLRDSAAHVELVAGDARLMLEREPDQHFDILVVDAFSGDAIPTHLLTNEAFALYFRHLQPAGILAVHVTNRYLDLAPVVAQLAELAGKPSMLIRTPGDAAAYTHPAEWVLVPGNAQVARALGAPASTAGGRRQRAWSDDYVNLLAVLR